MHELLPNPTELAQSFSAQWASYGNTTSPELIAQWELIFESFNQSYIRNLNEDSIEYSVIPAVTGSGKTQCLQWYAAELNKQFKDGPGILIVTKLNKEANRQAEQIVQWSGANINSAIAYNKDSKFKGFGKERHLDEYQTVIISHSYYIKHHHLESSGSKTFQQVLSYKGSERSIVVIDESIELIKHMSITHDLLKNIGSDLYKVEDELTNEFKLVTYLKGNFLELFGDIPEGIIGDKQRLIQRVAQHLDIDRNQVDELFNMKRAIKASKSNYELIDNLLQIRQLLNVSLYKHISGGVISYNSSSVELPKQSLTVLDATARVNKIYEHLPNVRIVKLPKVKDYSNVTINMKLTNSRSQLGKNGMVDKMDVDLSNLHLGNIASEVAMSEFSKSKFAVFSFKDLIEQSEESYFYGYGSLDGTNEHQDCEHIVIYGMPFRPNSVYKDILYQFGNSGSEKIQTFKYHHIATDIIQMVNRGICRKIKDGKALEMRVTLMLGGNSPLNQIIEDSIRSEMPGVVINKSQADHLMSFTNPSKKLTGNINKSDQAFLDCIDRSQDDIKITDIHKLAESSSKQAQGINKRVKDNTTWIGKEVDKLGYEMAKKGRYIHLVRVQE